MFESFWGFSRINRETPKITERTQLDSRGTALLPESPQPVPLLCSRQGY